MKNSFTILLILSSVVIVLAIFVYSASSKISPSATYEREITRIETTSNSDEVDSIEEDLEQTDIDSLDSELTLIEAELN